ncbi:PTS sugar transporter subunit IIA [Limosilactobacillus fermentum]
MLFDKEVILFNQDASDNVSALTRLADSMYAKGVVTSEYRDALLKREESCPTGLMTQTIGVAIPHTDPDKVIEPQIGFMSLKHPVTFHQMGDNAEIQVKLIFMLALKKSDDQLSMLQKLMALFQNQEAMDALQKIEQKNDFLDLMKKNEIIE